LSIWAVFVKLYEKLLGRCFLIMASANLKYVHEKMEKDWQSGGILMYFDS